MAQASLSVHMDEDLKKQFDGFCSDVGMNMSTAINIYVKKVVKERRIPFEISAANDPFYSSSNINHLEKVISKIESGNSKFVVKTMEELEEMENE